MSTKENLQVLYEDNHIIAVNKRVGDIVQGDKTKDIPLSDIVKQYLREKYQKPGDAFLGVVHRLDRPTSGVVVFAKTSKALSRLNALFASKRQTQKTYWAITETAPEKPFDRLEHWMVRNTTTNKSKALNYQEKNSKHARLSYYTCANLDRYTFLEISLETGRHHQIRAQLSAINCPIKGDLKYGAKRSNPDSGISLHARSLSFVHPVKKQPITIVAPTPTDNLWHFCEQNYPKYQDNLTYKEWKSQQFL